MSERLLRADAARNRDKILAAAREAFAASGYGAPLDEIAALAGVGPGTIYRHFPTKEALFEAVVTARVADLIDDARERAGAEDADSAFFGFLARIADEAAAKRDLPDAITIGGSLQHDLYAALDVLLRNAQEAGAVRADISARELLVLLKSLITSIRDAPPDTTVPAMHDLVLAVVADGLRQQSPRRVHPS
jgi:AcrR family transcriptional regulator